MRNLTVEGCFEYIMIYHVIYFHQKKLHRYINNKGNVGIENFLKGAVITEMCSFLIIIISFLPSGCSS